MPDKTEIPQIEWGWRIQCAEEGCDCYMDAWRSDTDNTWGCAGYPPLPHGYHGYLLGDEEAHPGWFFYYGPGYGKGRVAYCPEHSAPAIAWQKAERAWNSRRSDVGRKTHLSLLDKVKEWWDPREKQRRISKAVEAWKQANPRPLPPWQPAA